MPSEALRRLYSWTIHWSRTKNASYALFFIAFAESSFFPIPPDAVMIPMVVANRRKWLKFALICTAGSVTGALLGFAIGWLLWESVGRAIVDFYHLHTQMDYIGVRYKENAFIAILGAAFTPIPYKVFTLSAGLFMISVPVLIVASIIGRGARFFLVAGLLRIFGERISRMIEKYFDILALLFFLLLIGGFLVVRYLR